MVIQTTRSEYERQRRNNNKEEINKRRRIRYQNSELYRNHCKDLKKKYRLQDPIHWYAMETIRGHRRKGFIININVEEIKQICKRTPNCSICGVTINYFNLKSKDSPSLDRINNENILTKDNVQLLCLRCNRTKGNMIMKEFIEYCSNVADRFIVKLGVKYNSN